ncbi:LLM class flavin-dependent oxidoreductase [Nocardia flavorosea]|uniref:LLM class flavin-dependent oxidoreductase n=1 Tax=Nocardia flavorosea TaxID=53429 RepID=A0A846YSD0_9NOCA|nr:LLM class flavin-dependent oxidoreductase [Nocardia flavorosea]NKY60591.1 LLM class flavin-dependent oxidoreductase [Nocardia flavorosea]
MKVGAGLWTFQSTAAHPIPVGSAYQGFADDAARLESLGFDDVWLGEHRLWYDGWCPAPLMALAAAAARTSTIGLGTAMLLLPQHDPARVSALATALGRISGGRLRLGVGLGHRDAEFDALGIARATRGARMGPALDALLAAGSAAPDIWVGGMAPTALARLGSRGMSALLPQSLTLDATARAIATIRDAAKRAGVAPGRIGMMKDVWVDADGVRGREWFLPRLREHYREEAGAWWVLGSGGHGFTDPAGLERQVDRVADAAIVGSPDTVTERLRELARAGVEHLVVRSVFDFTAGPSLWPALELFAHSVLPRLRQEQPS